MNDRTTDPVLLTPGPLTTSAVTRAAMLRDWGSWDSAFNALTATVRQQLLEVVGGAATHTCVPMQGSGTFAVEAALGTLVPPRGRVLVPNNGAYCARMLRILRVLGREAVEVPFDECAPVDAAVLEAALVRDPHITHVAFVHCETGTGVLNPLDDVAAVCARQGRALIVDAMSSFGALPMHGFTQIDCVNAGNDAMYVDNFRVRERLAPHGRPQRRGQAAAFGGGSKLVSRAGLAG